MRAARGLALLVVGLAAAPASAAELHVYSSLPLRGPSAVQTRDIVRGIRLALRQSGGRAGAFDIRYRSLDDSTRVAGYWDPGQVAENARRVARDARAILYIGEFNSGASTISMPILNMAAIPQISPSNTYAGLTEKTLGTCCREPRRYFPTGERTYLRMVAHDRIQSAALVTQMLADGCTRLAIADDGDTYGHMVAGFGRTQARRLGLPVVAYAKTRDRKPSAIAEDAAAASPDCFLFGGVTANRAVPIVKAVAGRVPAARIYGGDGICEPGFTRRAAALAPRFACTQSALPMSAYPGGAAFASAFASAFGGRSPESFAAEGYEAMRLGLDAIAAAGDRGSDKAEVLDRLFATRDRSSVFGPYSIEADGDTTRRDYGMYAIAGDGYPVFRNVVVARYSAGAAAPHRAADVEPAHDETRRYDGKRRRGSQTDALGLSNPASGRVR